MLLPLIFLTASIILTLLFFLYGFNHYYLLSLARKYKPPNLENASGFRPRVSVQIPIYNEKYVIRRIVTACAHMAEAYGIDKVNTIIIDDSDDDTKIEVDQSIAEYLNRGFKFEVIRRGNRNGFKAGALQVALERTKEDFIAVFDADFIPPPNFLIRTLPYFIQDECLGIIQSRWTHINRNYNLLTRAIAIGIDVHFLIEQAGRYEGGYFQNFNGSGGILRKKALLEAGGWQSDTLAEDLDASYRVLLQGYRFLYLKDVQSEGEIPPSVPSFKKQQARWANGSLRTAKKILPTLLTNHQLSVKQRFQAFIHLTGYMIQPLMFTSFILACVTSILSVDSIHLPQVNRLFQYIGNPQAMKTIGINLLQETLWVVLGLTILVCTIAAWVTPVAALRIQKLPLLRNLPILLVLYLLGTGISLSNTLEAGKALLTNRIWEFRRTPKYAIGLKGETWQGKRYQVPLDLEVLLELAFLCLGLYSIGDAASHSNIGIFFILLPYTIALAFVFIFSIRQSRI